MGLEGAARDALGVRLVQKVVGGNGKDPGACVHPGNAAMVAQRYKERIH